MRLRLLPSFALFTLAGVIPACGSLSSDTNGDPALATVVGEVVNPNAIPVEGSVRVAVVWQAVEGQFNVAQDVPVQPVFPSSFTIQLDGPPPASALFDSSDLVDSPKPTSGTGTVSNGAADAGDAEGAGNLMGQAGKLTIQGGGTASSSGDSSGSLAAVGVVVAYLDKNGNGKLDLVPDGASGYVDQILATNETEVLIYFQGSVPAGASVGPGVQPQLGYNLYNAGCNDAVPVSYSPGSLCTTPTVPDAGTAGPDCSNTKAWLAFDTPVTLSVSNDPQVNNLMCQTPDSEGGEASSATQTESGQPASYPDVCDANLACAADGSSYTYGSCQTVQTGLCEGTVTTCSSVQYLRPNTVPAGWPCKS